MQGQLRTILKNLATTSTCKRINVVAGPRSTHHNIALNAVLLALIENNYDIDTLGCDFWGPEYYPPNSDTLSQDQLPFNPRIRIDGLVRFLSSLPCLEFTVPPFSQHTFDNAKTSCNELQKALALCDTDPKLIFRGHSRRELQWAREDMWRLPLHTIILEGITIELKEDLTSLLEVMEGSLRVLRLDRIRCRGEFGWQLILLRIGQLLALDHVKFEGLVNVDSSDHPTSPQELTSKPYSYEEFGREKIRTHLLQLDLDSEDWEPRLRVGEVQN
ncbi:uncharacterized protein RHO25_002432 [Cercospora beticola]|uniref:SRR1-like domain-containing protein n=1 Tax=Cercospora beticola TaxID=122368 RepID=A0ABZ0NE79_CERBT|nr:hypothetical protein RHO25_002432 [Cercospora beticola]